VGKHTVTEPDGVTAHTPSPINEERVQRERPSAERAPAPPEADER
jgi:hypothetical protein